MKKILIALIGLNLVLPLIAFAAIEAGSCKDYCDSLNTPDPKDPPANQICLCPPVDATLEIIITRISDFLFYLAVVLAPLMLIIAGFLFVTAAGDAEKITQAKKIITWTIIGFFIVLVSKAIVALITGVIGG